MNHARGKLSKNQPAEEKVEEDTTVFTDRDFDMFEAEYEIDHWGKR